MSMAAAGWQVWSFTMPLPNEIVATVTNTVGKVASVVDKTELTPRVRNSLDWLKANEANLIAALVIVAAGVLISRWLGRIVARTLEGQPMDPPVRLLLVRFARFFTLGVAVVLALEVCDLHLTALITGVGVLGVGVGFAMQGLLGNMVAGLTIIVTKPFRVGDYVEILNVRGVVSHIDLISTALQHADLSQVIIPNHKIMGEILHNYGTTRQLDLSVGVGYGSDLNRVQGLLMEILQRNPRVLRDPAPVVAISALGDSSINVAVKPWVKLADFGLAQSELNAAIIAGFRASNIEIPFPQREIRVFNASTI
jgi:small conductance mechanosensitive channel